MHDTQKANDSKAPTRPGRGFMGSTSGPGSGSFLPSAGFRKIHNTVTRTMPWYRVDIPAKRCLTLFPDQLGGRVIARTGVSLADAARFLPLRASALGPLIVWLARGMAITPVRANCLIP